MEEDEHTHTNQLNEFPTGSMDLCGTSGCHYSYHRTHTQHGISIFPLIVFLSYVAGGCVCVCVYFFIIVNVSAFYNQTKQTKT